MTESNSLLELVIFGADGFAREVAAWAESATWGGTRFHLRAFVDDPNPGRTLRGRPVVRLSELPKGDELAFVVGVGNPSLRERLTEEAQSHGLRVCPPLVHPNVVLDCELVSVGDGTVICAGCTLTTDIDIGRHSQINLHCTLGHDVRLGEYATLAPGVHISGRVDVGRAAYFGTGAVTIDGRPDRRLVVGERAVVGAGAVITRDVPAATTVVGVPARAR